LKPNPACHVSPIRRADRSKRDPRRPDESKPCTVRVAKPSVPGCGSPVRVVRDMERLIGVFGAGWQNRRRLPRALVVGAVHLLLALAVVCGPVQAGARYFYCEALGLSASDPCAASGHSASPCPFQSIEPLSVDCCSVITLPSMPRGASVDESRVPPARFVAILPAREFSRPMAGAVVAGFVRGVQRCERPPRPGGDLRTQLMVYLT